LKINAAPPKKYKQPGLSSQYILDPTVSADIKTL